MGVAPNSESTLKELGMADGEIPRRRGKKQKKPIKRRKKRRSGLELNRQLGAHSKKRKDFRACYQILKTQTASAGLADFRIGLRLFVGSSIANTDSHNPHNTQHVRVKQNKFYFMQNGT
jgi:hypothetical protein